MAVKWTPEQKQVIDSRNQNLLVAAAAGSGKTAVLVQHILELITDPVHPVDVTNLLVVTFTRAAAGEMRERLRARLTEHLEEEPWNIHVQKQIPLLEQAHISTIDSFCQWMVKNYFHQLDLDPDFRIADEGEGKLLREEVLEKILEASYEQGDAEFLHLMDAFSSGKGDRNIRDMIEKLYLFADSAPWPGEWLENAKSSLEEPAVSLPEYPWMKALDASIRDTLAEYQELLEEAIAICEQDAGFARYGEMFRSDTKGLATCLATENPEELLHALSAVEFMRKPVIPKKMMVDESLKAELSLLRDAVRDQVKRLAKRYGGETEQMARWIAVSAGDRRALITLTQQFSEAYRQAKKERNLADFADVEHWALDLLIERKDDISCLTNLAAELGDTFREIIVDEYQDSNLVQETLLRALSGEARGHANMFMVGDVKQSIYKFRMARPELFMDKYRRFTYEEERSSPGRKIDLGRNFRSRGRILSEVNALFYRIMGESFGGVEYDEHAALYSGASYPEEDPAVEMQIAERLETDAPAVELEGKLIAERIRRLLDPQMGLKVWEEKEGRSRPAEYRDIVILLRSLEGWADTLTAVLAQEGIPAFAQLRKGYFAAQEVQVLLNFLRVLDNPRQDIPLASVLCSPIGGFSKEELAWMAAGTGDGDFYERCRQAAEWGRNTEKWQRFEEILLRYRRDAALYPIHEILERILAETDYGLILAARPGGKVRMANVDMLRERAMAFEETSYHGIFQFIRYMEKLQRYEVDYGEAQVLSENENLVRITSIHKSKGLEYPIVIVAGMGKGFNLQDARAPMLIHEDLGLACDAVDVEKRLRHPTLWKKVVADRIEQDAKGEELRVLYVAMTRAKEKLILTGTCDSWQKVQDKWILSGIINRRAGEQDKLPSSLVQQAGSYLDWLTMAYEDNPFFEPELTITSAEELIGDEIQRIARGDEWKALWEKADVMPEQDAEFRHEFETICGYVYPFRAVCHQKAAMSVSELKHRAAEEYLAEEGMPATEPDDEASPDSRVISDDNSKSKPDSGFSSGGAWLGTVYHKVLEWIPPEDGADGHKVYEAVGAMREQGVLNKQEMSAVRVAAVTAFYRSSLGQRMVAAHRKGRLYREQPFVMGLPLREIVEDTSSELVPEDEWVMVQGIIDAFIEEEDGLVLWDYKTDAVPAAGGRERLIGLYREQLREYKRALERAHNKKVKEVWIYSFALQEAIEVPGV